MTLLLWVLVFYISGFLTLVSVAVGGLPLVVAAGVFLPTALYLNAVMVLRAYVYTAAFLFFHLAMTVFAVYVYLNHDRFVTESVFIFSAFTESNLRMAVTVLLSSALVILGSWLLFMRRRGSVLQLSLRDAMTEMIGKVERVDKRWILVLMAASLTLAVFLLLTNTSVLQVMYPYNRNYSWASGELYRIPIILVVAALFAAYVRYLSDRGAFRNVLILARLNCYVTPSLMLLLFGQRGLVTFLWVFIGFFELYLWLKRRGGLGWFLSFMLLAWLSYYSWGFLRVNLASMPLDAALWQGLKIGLFLGEEPNMDAGSGLYVSDFKMLDMSLFHLLYVIELVADGISLGGETFVNLIPQALPSILDGILWDRPLNDNWKLGEYYRHEGGFLLVANAYWNGGLWVALVFMAALSSVFVGMDRYLVRPSTGFLYKLMYWLWMPVMVIQLGYGIQGMVRLVEFFVLLMLIDRIKWRRSSLRALRGTASRQVSRGVR